MKSAKYGSTAIFTAIPRRKTPFSTGATQQPMEVFSLGQSWEFCPAYSLKRPIFSATKTVDSRWNPTKLALGVWSRGSSFRSLTRLRWKIPSMGLILARMRAKSLLRKSIKMWDRNSVRASTSCTLSGSKSSVSCKSQTVGWSPKFCSKRRECQLLNYCKRSSLKRRKRRWSCMPFSSTSFSFASTTIRARDQSSIRFQQPK